MAPVEHDQRRTTESGLAGSVNHDRGRGGRQGRLRGDCLNARPGDVEVDRVRRGQRTGDLELGRRAQGRDGERAVADLDRLAERKGRIAGIVRVGHGVHDERRQETSRLQVLDPQPAPGGALDVMGTTAKGRMPPHGADSRKTVIGRKSTTSRCLVGKGPPSNSCGLA